MSEFVTPSAFVADLPLALQKSPLGPDFAFAQSEDLPVLRDVIEQGEGFVDAGSVVAFVGSLEAGLKRDVLESTLFAQLAANAAANRLVDPQGWYKQYQTVLSSLGWSIGSFTLIKQSFRKSRIEVAEAAIDILSKALGGLSLGVLETALESIRGLKDDDGIIELFDSSATADNVANFQIGQASADGDGNITMPIGFFYFQSDSAKKKFLFFRWSRKRVNLFADAQIASMNKYIYDLHREAVRGRLKDITAALVRSIPLSAS